MVDIDLGTASGLLASRCRTSPMCAWYTSSMAQGTRYPCGSRSDSGSDERFGRSKRCSNAESRTPGSFAGTQVLRPPLAVKRASLPMIFERNSERMRYARYRAEKLFVGSGVVEAGCKTVIGRRLKMSGMFWTLRGANSLIALRCNRISGKFTDYWESRAA